MDDNFGFRNSFIYFHNLIKIKLFNLSPNDRVLIGKTGWLYFDQMFPGKIDTKGVDLIDSAFMESVKTDLENNKEEIIVDTQFSIPDYLGLVPFRESDLIQIKNSIEAIEIFLSKRNIQLVLVLVPNKHTIYPEFLPDWILSIHRKKTKLDQVIEYMNKNSYFKIYDYRNVFLKNKINQNVYAQLDTHLSNAGNFLFANEIISNLNHPKVKKFELSDFHLDEKLISTGDLVDIAGSPGMFQEKFQYFHLKNPSSVDCPSENNAHLKSKTSCTLVNNSSLPSVIIYGDSFGENLSLVFKEKFKKYILFSKHLNIEEDTIMKEQPDFLIIELVERSISRFKKISISKR